MQNSDWNCGNLITPNHKKKPFDDVRVRRALTLAIDQLARRAGARQDRQRAHGRRHRLPRLAAGRDQGGAARQLAGFWPDIEKSRAEAKRLLKEAGAEGLSFELLNRNVDQPYKYVGTWLIDEWSKIGLQVTQRVVPTGPWFEAMRSGNFDVVVEANCQSVVNPLLDVQKYLPRSVFAENYGNYDDPKEIELYEQDAARDRSREAARADARVREARARHRGARDRDDRGGTGSCRTAPTSRAGRSARATTSTRIWRTSGSIK